ncbi:MAG: hypothetical protein JWO09_1021 [Bacteroidetes bacterium]|nr:hypothetical protein [Bacteroidota bacterium]
MSVIPEPRKGQIKELKQIPGVGVSIANDLIYIGITKISDLENKDPEWLYHQSNNYAGVVQDRCLLYVFRCAVYYATEKVHDKEKLKWWNWKDVK